MSLDHTVADRVCAVLDSVLVPLGFAAGQGGIGEDEGQVIFCRGSDAGADDGCIDLVVDLTATPMWHVAGIRYWGFTSDRWHLAFPEGAPLDEQLAELARTLPSQLEG